MMTIADFFKTYYNKQVEYDGVANFQCIDYLKLYLNKHLGIKPGSWGNAKDYGLKAENSSWPGYGAMHKYFEWLPGKQLPERGDVVVFNGTYGHVGVADGDSNAKGFYIYEQNWNSKKYVQRNRHFYTDMLGVWRPKWNVVTTDLNIREMASSNSDIIGLYRQGELVQIIDKKYGWKKTNKGWCFAKYLD